MAFDIATARPMDSVGGGFDLSTAVPQHPDYDKHAFDNGPLKIGKDAFGDSLRGELKNASWFDRNLAGAGTALSNLYEGAKQFAGQGNEQNIANNKIIEEEAPIGAFAGNAALTAVPFGLAGKSIKAAGAVGAAVGALNPVEGDQSVGNVVKGKLENAAEGAVFGSAGQALANVGGKMVAKKISDRMAAGLKNAPIDKTLKDAIDAGLVVPPSSVNPSALNTLKEGIAGKIATAQTASNRNGEVIDSLARKAVGLPEDAPLTSEAMQGVRRKAYQDGYEPIASLGSMPTDSTYHSAIDAIANKYQGVSRSFPGAVNDDIAKLVEPFRVGDFDAGDALKASQFLRDKANAAFRAGNKEEGLAAKGLAKAVEDQIERNLSTVQSGAQATNPVTGPNGRTVYMTGADMLKNFRDARQLMAKAHTVEDAIVEGGGTVNPRKLAQRVQAGKPMSGELETIGNFANNFPKATQPAQQVAGPGVSKLNGLAALLTGGSGMAVGGPIGALVAGAAPFVVPPVVRGRLLSKSVQKGLIPSYGPTVANRLQAALLENSPVGLTALGLQALGE